VDVIMIPGFWLDSSSWGEIPDALRAAGHTVHTPTPPGLESRDADRSGITIQDHIDAVVALIDGIDGPVALVGHSGGGNVIYGAADARVDRIARLAFVDCGPMGDGAIVNDGFPAENGEIPLPDWESFEPEELADMDSALRASLRARSIPEPEHVAIDPLRLSDERRRAIPTTVITSTFPSEKMRELMAAGSPYVAELALMNQATIVDLPTGHWPQLTKPLELAEVLVAALASRHG
jgi:pimeloyl-ACP methyl ester carboxylesterase